MSRPGVRLIRKIADVSVGYLTSDTFPILRSADH